MGKITGIGSRSLEEGPLTQKLEWVKEQTLGKKSLEECLRQRGQGGPGYQRGHRGEAALYSNTCV